MLSSTEWCLYIYQTIIIDGQNITEVNREQD